MLQLTEKLFYKKNKLKKLLISEKYNDLLVYLHNICNDHMLTFSDYDISRYIVPYNKNVSIYYNIKYINASFIEIDKEIFIACQDPKFKYINLFLEFIEKADFQCILSLNIDSEYIKEFYKKYTLRDSKIIKFKDRPFILDETFVFNNKIIRRVNCMCWEDHSVMSVDEMECLYAYMEQFDHKLKIIHCKAGVGRTGTFIMYRILRKYKEVTVDVFIDVLLRLRSQRNHLVTNSVQLKFLYEIFVKKMNVENNQKQNNSNEY